MNTTSRLLRGYGPLVAFTVLFVLMAVYVPTVGSEVRTVERVVAGGDRAAPAGAGEEAGLAPGGAPGSPAAERGTRPPVTAGPSGGPTTAATGAGGQVAAPAGGSAQGTTPGTQGPAPAGGGVQPCPDRQAQVPGDPYSPPCLTFAGGNGGATSPGVTAQEIVVAARVGGLPDFSAAPNDDGPATTYSIDKEEIKRTFAGLADYFNSRFQFYGRKLKMAFYEGEGDYITELQGGGQEQVEADAIRVADEIGAFADLTGFTAPYTDALARRAVIAFGAPYVSREWMAQRRPYAWSPATDCTFISETVTDYSLKRLAGKPARFAGAGLADQPRRFAIIAPENPWYQECVQAGQRVWEAAGQRTTSITYNLDFSTLSNQAASVVAKLKSDKATTVLCACDPVFPIFLTAKAQEQGYEPEWIVTGAALVDVDVLGQLYQQDQWSRAFGISFLGPMQPLRATHGYAAFKLMRPDEEPSPFVDILYHQMYLLAAGVHMAGPNLTPPAFEAGMFAWPGGSGLAGTWKFSPGRYTPTVDAREVYWDPDATSAQNNERGAYVETEPGQRYRPGRWPAGDPAVFAN